MMDQATSSIVTDTNGAGSVQAAQDQKPKRPRASVEERETAIRNKIAAMQAELEKLEQQKLDRQAKKLDKMWKRLRIHMVSLGLTDVPVEAIELLLTENVDKIVGRVA